MSENKNHMDPFLIVVAVGLFVCIIWVGCISIVVREQRKRDPLILQDHNEFMRKQNIKVAVSGGFDPVHIGHLRMFKQAREYGSYLVVILNNDDWLIRKKQKVFMSQEDRKEIIEAFSCVNQVYIQRDNSDNVCECLKALNPTIFINGGDRRSENDIPEEKICRELGIKMLFNIGGDKIRSSSDLLNNYEKSNK